MPGCQKCWNDAVFSGNKAAEYNRLIDERKDNPCTPEEQAGREADICPKCKRKALHEINNQCMNCSFQN